MEGRCLEKVVPPGVVKIGLEDPDSVLEAKVETKRLKGIIGEGKKGGDIHDSCLL